MRKMAILAALAVAFAGPALAGPKDQTKDSLIGPQALTGNATVNNDTTSFTMQTKGCSLQLKAKGLTGTTDGDILICIAEADVVSPPALPAPGAGNGVVILGEVKKGGLSLKVDISEIGCGIAEQINFNGDVKCYLDDPAYRASGGTWTTLCLGQGMAPVTNAHIALMDAKTLKVSGEAIVQGLCQGLTFGARLPGPSSPLIAQRGSRGFIVP